jgi:formate/nitrite transporter FocA (FNT family)
MPDTHRDDASAAARRGASDAEEVSTDRDAQGRPVHVIEEAGALTPEEVEKVVERVGLRAPAVYAVIKEEGEAELSRPGPALFWSGLAAGVAMGFSILAMSLLKQRLPDGPWAPLIYSFGYSAGFLLVILGRQQLFTESTITAVLPVLARRRLGVFLQMLRVWGIVLAANWLGCVLVALGFVTFALVPEEAGRAVLETSRHYVDIDARAAFVRGIGAGFLIAAMVWAMPSAEANKLLLIVLVTWLIALGGFTHVVAGMVEIAALAIVGEISFVDAVFTLALPTLAGNVLGGTGLFSMLAHVQVANEVEDDVAGAP